VTRWDEKVGVTNLWKAFWYNTLVTSVVKPPSTVTTMRWMFVGASRFNDPSVKDWNTSNVTNMDSMFTNATLFSQDLSGWNVSKVTACAGFADGSAMLPAYLPKFAIVC
jgi:surface protein